MVEFRFKPTVQDYTSTARARLLVSLRQPRLWVFPVLLAMLSVSRGLLSVVVQGEIAEGAFFLLLPVLIALLLLVLLHFLPSRRLARQVQEAGERLLGEVRWRLDDEGVSIENKFGETKSDWGTFRDLIELKDYYLLAHAINTNMFHFVPKRAFESPDQEAAFRMLVAEKLHPLSSRATRRRALSFAEIVLLLAVAGAGVTFLVYMYVVLGARR